MKVKAGGRFLGERRRKCSVAAHMWCVWAWGAGIEGKMLGSQDSILKVEEGKDCRVAGRVWAWSDWWLIRTTPNSPLPM